MTAGGALSLFDGTAPSNPPSGYELLYFNGGTLYSLNSSGTSTPIGTPTAAGIEATFTAKGQLYVGTGNGTGTLQAVGADNTVLTAASGQSDGVQWTNPITITGGAGLGIYGDASDGAQTFDGAATILGMAPSSNVYTMTRDIFLGSSTINNGVSIISSGFRLLCQGTLTNNGTIQYNGANGGNGGSGTGGSAGAALNNVGSISTSSVWGTAGGAGATGAGSTSSAQSTAALGGRGGHGANGANGSGQSGTVTVPTASMGTLRLLPYALIGMLYGGAGTWQQVFGGTGGGGGGGDNTNGGGGGGGAGGLVVVAAKAFAGTGNIRARGGNGGNGFGTGNTGGGGGGGGGLVVVVSGSVSGGAITGQTIDANGGSLGTSNGTGGANGAAGANGTTIIIPN